MVLHSRSQCHNGTCYYFIFHTSSCLTSPPNTFTRTPPPVHTPPEPDNHLPFSIPNTPRRAPSEPLNRLPFLTSNTLLRVPSGQPNQSPPATASMQPCPSPRVPSQEQVHTTPQPLLNFALDPLLWSSADEPPPAAPRIIRDTPTVQELGEKLSRPSVPPPPHPEPLPSPPPLTTEEDTVVPASTNKGRRKGKNQQDVTKASQVAQPPRSSSRVSKPPIAIAPLGRTAAPK